MQRRTSANAAARVKTDDHWLIYQLHNWLNFITRDWPGLYVYKKIEEMAEKRKRSESELVRIFHISEHANIDMYTAKLIKIRKDKQVQ